MFATKKLALAISTGVLGASLTGAVAFAAYVPTTVGATDLAYPGGATTVAAERGAGDVLAQVLDRLVANGSITAAQRHAIVTALREAREHRDGDGRHFFKEIAAELMRLSGEYLGLTKEQLAEQLRSGKSLGQIADATPGKSKDGLVEFLVRHANARIDEAIKNGRITEEQGAKLKAHAATFIERFVNKTWNQRPRQQRPVDARGVVRDVRGTASAYLGIDGRALREQLRSGKSLGEIAQATAGKSKSGLVAALTTAANTTIDKAVAEGQMTAEQARAAKAKAADAIAKLVDRKGEGTRSN